MNRFILPLGAFLLTSIALPAHADCVQDPNDPLIIGCLGPAAGGGPGLGGLNDNRDDLDIFVDVIDVLTGDGLRVRGDNVSVDVIGEIRTDEFVGGDGIDGGDGLTVDVIGDIIVGNRGIDADDKDDVTVTVSGSIQAKNDGIRLGNGKNADITLNNFALISSGDEGIEAGDDADITLASGAEVRATEDAIQVGENANITIGIGAVVSSSVDGDGIDIDSGRIFNEGLIEAMAPGEAGVDVDGGATGDLTIDIAFDGAVRGETGIMVELGDASTPANTRSQTVLVFGELTGTGGVAASLGAGDDTVRVADSNAVVNGLVDLGADDDTLSIGNLGFFDVEADGGWGFDIADFGQLDFSTEITNVMVSGNTLSFLALQGGAAAPTGGGTFTLSNFESFAFADGTRSAASFGLVAPVPLPASVWLMLAGVAGLGAVKRLRRPARG